MIDLVVVGNTKANEGKFVGFVVSESVACLVVAANLKLWALQNGKLAPGSFSCPPIDGLNVFKL